jgi:hypothetical protein
MGICFCFVGDLFLLDDFGDYRLAQGDNGACTAWENDERTGELKKHPTRHEGTTARTRAWIQEWLLHRLNRYHSKPFFDIQKAADRGEFRYLGRQCRLGLIDTLRKIDPLDHPRLTWLDDPVGDGETTFGNAIGTESPCPSADREALIEFIADNMDALNDVMIELMVYVECAYANDLREGTITRAIAKSRRVGERQARIYKRKFLDNARRAKHPALRELFLLLQPKYRYQDLGKEKEESI